MSKSGQATTELPAPSVFALGAQGGIRPSSDVVLFENVFGDPRVQVVDASFDFEQAPNKSIHLHAVLSLRIATVDIGGGRMHTRVVVTSIDGDLKGKSRVVEFAIPNPRYDKMGNLVDEGNVLRPDLNNFLSMPGNQALGGVSAACHSITPGSVTWRRSSWSRPTQAARCRPSP